MISELTSTKSVCTVCSSTDIVGLFEIHQVPVHCNLLVPTNYEALNVPRGDISLAFCKACGHIFNSLFDPVGMKYSQDYENSLHFSQRFQEYARSLAEYLIERYNLHNKDIIEMGCGKGEFLMLLCKLGGNRGVGFDHSNAHKSIENKAKNRITFVRDFYSERYRNYKVDLICCRHVLEHINSPCDFLINLRQTINGRLDTTVYFEVPNVLFTLKDLGIWDLIYEHCSYFSALSLTQLLTSCGFQVIDLKESFGGQFLCVEAVPVDGLTHSESFSKDELKRMNQYVNEFSIKYRSKVKEWKNKLKKIVNKGKRVLIWGGGSKGVTFVNTLNIQDEIKYVVDINPRKQGMFIPGTGQRIVSPEFLCEYRPGLIIVMNPIYVNEVNQITRNMNVDTKVISA
ncbi:MAG: methyltransferase domain-containing protein [Candidatus Brocadiaceae bacterium]|nr:methyltransferase domain-containing protein [Candidatus Brocadiaceae bacterium]